MNSFILDTDTLTLLQHAHANVLRAVDAARPNAIFTTAITVQEQVQGRLAVLNAARSADRIALASDAFTTTITFLSKLQLLPMTSAAVLRFQSLVRLKLNVTGNDLRIAAIALDANATVVTRNLRDFGRVPGLQIVDWSV